MPAFEAWTDEGDQYVSSAIKAKIDADDVVMYGTISDIPLPGTGFTYADLATYANPDCKSTSPPTLFDGGSSGVLPGEVSADLVILSWELHNLGGATFTPHGIVIVDETDGVVLYASNITGLTAITAGGSTNHTFLIQFNRKTD